MTEEVLFNPIISLELWDQVQEKLATRKAKPRAPRNEDFLLSRLLICGNCGVQMSGGAREMRSGKIEHEFYCSTYQNWKSAGNSGQCDCRRHTIKQQFVLEVVEQYLADVGQEMVAVRESVRTGVLSPIKQYRNRHQQCWGTMFDSINEMYKYVMRRIGDGSVSMAEVEAKLEPGILESVVPIYTVLRREELDQLDAEYKRLDDELSESADRLLTMSKDDHSRLRNKIERKTAEIEAAMDEIESRRVNHGERCGSGKNSNWGREVHHERQRGVQDGDEPATESRENSGHPWGHRINHDLV